MRTKPAHIEPGCIYCDNEHNPDITCRNIVECRQQEQREIQAEKTRHCGHKSGQEESAMKLPTIHMNGTRADSLLEDNRRAAGVLSEAIEILSQVGPNGRDYYPQETGAFFVAQDEHYDRLKRLRSVLTELNTIAEHLADHL